MKNKKLLRAAAALLLVGVVGVGAVGCSFEMEQPNWVTQALCDHVFDEEEVLKEATCTEDGKIQKTCSDCGKTKITTVKATGHDVVEDEAVTATCTTPGLTAGSHCTTCGEVLVKQEEIPAVLHESYDPYDTCTVCEAVITPEILGYTEETLSVGDSLGGKWIRCYPSSKSSLSFTILDGIDIYVFSVDNNTYAGDVRFYIISAGGPPFLHDCIKFYKNEEGGYIDFFVEPGTVTYEGPNATVTVTIAEDTIIKSIGGSWEVDPVFLILE